MPWEIRDLSHRALEEIPSLRAARALAQVRLELDPILRIQLALHVG